MKSPIALRHPEIGEAVVNGPWVVLTVIGQEATPEAEALAALARVDAAQAGALKRAVIACLNAGWPPRQIREVAGAIKDGPILQATWNSWCPTGVRPRGRPKTNTGPVARYTLDQELVDRLTRRMNAPNARVAIETTILAVLASEGSSEQRLF